MRVRTAWPRRSESGLAAHAVAAAASDEGTCCDWLGTWCPWADCDEARALELAEQAAEQTGSPQVVVERGTDGEFYVTQEVAPDGEVTELDPIPITRPDAVPSSQTSSGQAAATSSGTGATQALQHTPAHYPVTAPAHMGAGLPSSRRPWVWPVVIGGAAAVLLLGAALIPRRNR
jgi:hypothetical protein